MLRLRQNLRLLLLAAWLILFGLAALGVIAPPSTLMGLLAIIAGALILAGR